MKSRHFLKVDSILVISFLLLAMSCGQNEIKNERKNDQPSDVVSAEEAAQAAIDSEDVSFGLYGKKIGVRGTGKTLALARQNAAIRFDNQIGEYARFCRSINLRASAVSGVKVTSGQGPSFDSYFYTILQAFDCVK